MNDREKKYLISVLRDKMVSASDKIACCRELLNFTNDPIIQYAHESFVFLHNTLESIVRSINEVEIINEL